MWDEEEHSETLTSVNIDSALVSFSVEDWLEQYESFEVYVPHTALGVTQDGSFVIDGDALGYRGHQPYLHSVRVSRESENADIEVALHRNVLYMHQLSFAYFRNQIPVPEVELFGTKKLVMQTVESLQTAEEF